MACTTILVGKKASYDGSTMIARNDDSPSGVFCAKKLVVVEPSTQPQIYKSKISHVEIQLPNDPMRYSAVPSVDNKNGIWAASGVNEMNVGMTATETITSNARVLGADPLVRLIPAADGKQEVEGGIGEEDLVVLVLPYIKSAREGVIRLGSLLEKYGTYESNGIAFSDVNEVWWLESIGGHNWIARKVKDDEYVVMPNQFGIDKFDFEDAEGKQIENLCSKGLREFVESHHLNLNLDDQFNPRLAFGSHDDSDHVYNTPRAWFIERYLNPRTYSWDGQDAEYRPEDDDILWSLVPERKITVEDMKYLLSSYYQGTPYNPYAKDATKATAKYRPIGISRTSFMQLIQIRPNINKEYAALEWICFGSNAFNAMIPLYANMRVVPEYLTNTTLTVNTNNFYWSSRLIGALADAHFNTCSIFVERYQNNVASKGHSIINEYDEKLKNNKDIDLLIKTANEKVAIMAKDETDKTLDKILYTASCGMKNGFSRSDN